MEFVLIFRVEILLEKLRLEWCRTVQILYRTSWKILRNEPPAFLVREENGGHPASYEGNLAGDILRYFVAKIGFKNIASKI